MLVRRQYPCLPENSSATNVSSLCRCKALNRSTSFAYNPRIRCISCINGQRIFTSGSNFRVGHPILSSNGGDCFRLIHWFTRIAARATGTTLIVRNPIILRSIGIHANGLIQHLRRLHDHGRFRERHGSIVVIGR